MRGILRTPHWVLFTLAIASVLTLPAVLNEVVKVFASSVTFLWIFSVGYYGEQKRRLMKLEPKPLAFFQFNSFYVLIFGNLLILLERMLTDNAETPAGMEMLFLFIGLGSLYFFFALVYMIIFSARTIAEVEHGAPLTFSGYATRFLMLLFFAIGVWMIQPIVKRYLVEEYDDVNPFESI